MSFTLLAVMHLIFVRFRIFSGFVFSTGPISDWHIVSSRVDMSRNRMEIILEWRDPHDIRGNASVVDYHFNIENGERVDWDGDEVSPILAKISYFTVDLSNRTMYLSLSRLL